MWLFRGAQSAVFYYTSCAPCDQYHDFRRRKKNAAKTRTDASRDAIVTEQPLPIAFQQACPFSANEYWAEEIALGPGPPAKRGGRKNAGSRTGSARAASLPVQPPGRIAGDGAQLDGKVQKRDKDNAISALGERWNRLRYQREDEELWGVKVKRSSVGLSGRARSNTGDSTKYYTARNPEVNDLHPPVACGPQSREETRWMFQPPPSAKVMAGKVRVDPTIRRSRAESPPLQKRARPPFASVHPSSEADQGRNSPSGNNSMKCHMLNGDHAHADISPTGIGKSPYSEPPAIIVSKDSPPASPTHEETSNAPSKRPHLVMLASAAAADSTTEESRTDLNTLSPSSDFNARSNSPSSVLPDSKECPRPILPSSSKVRHASLAKADSNDKAFPFLWPSSSAWPTDLDVLQFCRVHLDLEPDESLAMESRRSDDDSQPPHAVRPFRWSMDI